MTPRGQRATPPQSATDWLPARGRSVEQVTESSGSSVQTRAATRACVPGGCEHALDHDRGGRRNQTAGRRQRTAQGSHEPDAQEPSLGIREAAVAASRRVRSPLESRAAIYLIRAGIRLRSCAPAHSASTYRVGALPGSPRARGFRTPVTREACRTGKSDVHRPPRGMAPNRTADDGYTGRGAGPTIGLAPSPASERLPGRWRATTSLERRRRP
jgi:hypothetical protein